MKTDNISLKECIEMRFEASDKAVNAALAAAKEAVLKSENASERRFESVNEFRATLSDQQKTLIPRMEAELIIKGLADRIKVLEDIRTEKTGQRSGAMNLWATIIGVLGVLGIVFGFVTYFIK